MSIEQKLAELGAAPTWRPGRTGDYLVRSDGKVIGEVCRNWGGNYNATKNGQPIGEFYTEEQAKRAVEGPSP